MVFFLSFLARRSAMQTLLTFSMLLRVAKVFLWRSFFIPWSHLPSSSLLSLELYCSREARAIFDLSPTPLISLISSYSPYATHRCHFIESRAFS